MIDEREYEVVIIKKNNKNSYIRVKEDMRIYVSTNYFTSKRHIKNMLNENIAYLKKMLDKVERKVENSKLFYYLGKKYDIIMLPEENITILDNRIYVKNYEVLEKWYHKQASKIFQERLDVNYALFEERIPYPKLRIRKMKTRWGVCNRKNMIVTLNLDLLKYDISALDYVIIHELSHFIQFNHSSSFWNVVSKYCSNYKQIRNMLKG